MVAYYTLARKVADHARVRETVEQLGTRVVTVFVSPFSDEEIGACTHPEHILLETMRGRQLERALREAVRSHGMVEASRAAGAWHRTTTLLSELQARRMFDRQLVVRNGYLPEVWDGIPPPGDAGKALAELVTIVAG